MIKNYLVLIRPEEWVLTFFILVVGYILAGNVSLAHINSILVAFLSFFSIGAFGFIINDYFDRYHDKKKTKNRNPISKNYIRKESAIVLASIFGIIGLTMSYFLISRVFALFLLSFILLILYSVPPFRFKERPFFDVATDSLPMPILFLIGYMLFGGGSLPAFLIAFELFLLGLTRAIIQETRDYNADKKSGFYTTVIKIGLKRSVGLLRTVFILSLITYFLTIYLYFPPYFMILALSLYPYIKLIFSDNLKPDIASKTLNSINYKSHLILIFLTFIVVLLFYLKI